MSSQYLQTSESPSFSLPKVKRAAAYIRVSTANQSRQGDEVSFDQNPEVQEEPIRALITQRGWSTHRVYSDRAGDAKDGRPGLNALMDDARRGLFDVVIVWRFDRFARSAKQLVLALEEFRSLGIDFISHREALDTSTPMGKAMFTLIAAMAELEKDIIRERVVAGLDHAQRNGTKSGKPVGRPKAIVDADEVVRLRDTEKLSWPEIGRRTRSSSATVRRVYNAAVAQTCQNPFAQQSEEGV